MKRRTLGVVMVTFLVVFTGCAGSSSPSDRTQPSGAPDSSGSGDTPVNATVPSALANTPANTSDSRQSGPAANGTFELHSINVGQSDSTLIIGPTNQTMLIDTGDYRDDGEIVLDAQPFQKLPWTLLNPVIVPLSKYATNWFPEENIPTALDARFGSTPPSSA